MNFRDGDAACRVDAAQFVVDCASWDDALQAWLVFCVIPLEIEAGIDAPTAVPPEATVLLAWLIAAVVAAGIACTEFIAGWTADVNWAVELASGCTAWAVLANDVVVAFADDPTVFSDVARLVLAAVAAFVGAVVAFVLAATLPCEVAKLLLALVRPVTGAVAEPAALP
jgi:hypothetical protein